jgi:hypothetical protein
MEPVMSSKQKKFSEISKAIRERQEYSVTVLRKAIRDSVKEARSHAWHDKRVYGWETRHLLLTYAMLRGRPRSSCEKKSYDFPSTYLIENLCKEHGHPRTREQIKAWLEDESSHVVPEVSAQSIVEPTVLPPPVLQVAVPPQQSGFFGTIKSFFQRTV